MVSYRIDPIHIERIGVHTPMRKKRKTRVTRYREIEYSLMLECMQGKSAIVAPEAILLITKIGELSQNPKLPQHVVVISYLHYNM